MIKSHQNSSENVGKSGVIDEGASSALPASDFVSEWSVFISDQMGQIVDRLAGPFSLTEAVNLAAQLVSRGQAGIVAPAYLRIFQAEVSESKMTKL